MAGMGPPPNPNARRRSARPAQLTLPAAGRRGRPPKWPLPPEIGLQAELAMAEEKVETLELELADAETRTDARGIERKLDRARFLVKSCQMRIQLALDGEVALWTDLWRTPQAVAWTKLRWTREVAQYVRWKVKAEGGDLDSGKEARQLGDRLGLTPLSLLRLQWVIGDPAPAKVEEPSDNVVELFG